MIHLPLLVLLWRNLTSEFLFVSPRAKNKNWKGHRDLASLASPKGQAWWWDCIRKKVFSLAFSTRSEKKKPTPKTDFWLVKLSWEYPSPIMFQLCRPGGCPLSRLFPTCHRSMGTFATSNGKELMLDPFNRSYFLYQADESSFEMLWLHKVKSAVSKGQVFMSI